MDIKNGMVVKYQVKKNKYKLGVIGKENSIGDKYVVLSGVGTIKRDKIVEVWTPKLEEVCLFTNSNSKAIRLAKFQKSLIDERKGLLYKDMQNNHFENCYPFTKYFLKLLSREVFEKED